MSRPYEQAAPGSGRRALRLGPALGPLVALAVFCGGCVGAGPRDDRDPLEGFNRAVFAFNEGADTVLFGPLAEGYAFITPELVQAAITNFYWNVTYLDVILNDLLQGKVMGALSDLARFLINSTVGIGGLIDVAAVFGLERHEEDFGQTLGVWGVGEGAYLVLPLFGPGTLRDAPGLAVSAATNPFFYIGRYVVDPIYLVPNTVLSGIERRARAIGDLKRRDELALDPYAFTREAYLQRRTFLIYDGHPPLAGDLDALGGDLEGLDELDEEGGH